MIDCGKCSVSLSYETMSIGTLSCHECTRFRTDCERKWARFCGGVLRVSAAIKESEIGACVALVLFF